ncbi:MAG: hypothetical protein R2845_14365 [Thermomicrobiales bacterium]
MFRPGRRSIGGCSPSPRSYAVALVIAVVLRGPQRAALATAAALVVGLLFLQVHAGWRLAYLEGDVPRDMLIYTQTSPDIPLVAGDLTQLSIELEGDLGMEVLYDSRVAWPLQWYLRDFSNKRISDQARPLRTLRR